jgi:hypothetical protein
MDLTTLVGCTDKHLPADCHIELPDGTKKAIPPNGTSKGVDTAG